MERVIVISSGPARLAFALRNGGAKDFGLKDTGEGSVSVALDGKNRRDLGYVTSMNGIIILAIGADADGFSQIFPSVEPENGIAACGRFRQHAKWEIISFTRHAR
jgi:hypothetical protein